MTMEQQQQSAPPEEEEEEKKWGRRAWALLSGVRSRSPLVQCITNLVSMDLAANALLAAGASPAMVHSLREIPDFTPAADALYVNVGTLSESWLPSMSAAASAAASASRPWVLDPVAVSASTFRMEACLSLVALKPDVIRGNASEVMALSSATRIDSTKGVDSSHESINAIEAAKSLALASGAVVAVSGAVDYITDGHLVVGVHNGVAMLQKITATGCAVTALIAAFVAMEPSSALEATACALSIFGLAAEIGMDLAKGPASLRMHMIDSLHALDEQTVASRVRIADVC
ncbi:hydroxyethylthiazole kinase [Iris pallida]|uniref:Hydroxyethylthiazole kinase n=1 Tax=Iris pallida TaxID=29817 RepID=A0AAX6EPL5_IRIPA|nr:hydroxyethylthiazole kinase [Iris pallida]